MPPISFNEVPENVRVPWAYVEFDNSRANQGPFLLEYTILVIAQRLSSGTVAELVPTKVTRAEQGAQYFGQGSMAHNMLERLFENGRFNEVWVIAQDDDGAGVKAAGSILFGGAPTAAGTLNVYIAGRRVRISVTTSDTAADIASNLVDEITNNHPGLPVTAAVNGGNAEQVDITAKNAGEVGNGIDVRLNYYADEETPAGVTAVITDMAGGTGNPDVNDVITVMGDDWYHTIAMPYTDSANLTALEAELDDRFGPERQIEGVAFAAMDDTHANLGTFGSGRNSKHVSVMGITGSPTPSYEWAAATAATVAAAAQNDPARPFQTLELQGVLSPGKTDLFTLAERNLLLFDGISTFKVGADGKVRVERLITMYQTNQFGATDPSYLDVNTILTLGYLRYDFRNMLLTKYPRHKLGNDSVRYGAGQAILTPKAAKAEAVARFRQWEELALVEGLDQFKNDLIVERDESNPNRLNFLMPPDLVNQLRIMGVQFQFLL